MEWKIFTGRRPIQIKLSPNSSSLLTLPFPLRLPLLPLPLLFSLPFYSLSQKIHYWQTNKTSFVVETNICYFSSNIIKLCTPIHPPPFTSFTPHSQPLPLLSPNPLQDSIGNIKRFFRISEKEKKIKQMFLRATGDQRSICHIQQTDWRTMLSVQIASRLKRKNLVKRTTHIISWRFMIIPKRPLQIALPDFCMSVRPFDMSKSLNIRCL